MIRRGLHPARVRHVHAYPDLPASRILLEVKRGPQLWLNIEPPLVVHEPGGTFTPEVRRMLGEIGAADDAGAAIDETGGLK